MRALVCTCCLRLSKQLLHTRLTPLLLLLLLLLQVVAPHATPTAPAQQMLLTCHQAVKMMMVVTTASCMHMPAIQQGIYHTSSGSAGGSSSAGVRLAQQLLLGLRLHQTVVMTMMCASGRVACTALCSSCSSSRSKVLVPFVTSATATERLLGTTRGSSCLSQSSSMAQ
jgi:hypothetical protein